MFLFKKVVALQNHLEQKRQSGRSIGFVPTMGALHEGHASLIRHSIEKGHYTAVSIYVNPTQFNDPEDLKKYPRPISADLDFLHKLGCDVFFLPSDNEIYPDGDYRVPNIDLGYLNTTMEAAFRPEHFEGVLQVVCRLLDIFHPDILFMGQKDLQQLAVIRRLLEDSHFQTELVGLPIMREAHGLARSSRNEPLSPEHRMKASIIYDTLKTTAEGYGEKPLAELKQEALTRLDHSPFRPEYFEFVRADNLEIVVRKKDFDGAVSAVTALWCGDIRLIDNMEMPGR